MVSRNQVVSGQEGLEGPSLSRRALLASGGAVVGLFALGGAGVALGANPQDTLLRPPGAQDSSRFFATCLKCNRCETACPKRCLRMGLLEDGLLNWRTPIIDFHRGYCDFCGVCEDVCPAGSISGAHDATSVIGLAQVDSQRCIAWLRGGGCQVCVDVCPYGAITLHAGNCPVVDAQACNGCGLCENQCPSSSYLSFEGGTSRGINVQAVV